jgi:hypothetical protein
MSETALLNTALDATYNALDGKPEPASYDREQLLSLIQGSADWEAARIGRITGSRFADILTQPRSKKDKEAGALSKTAESYMLDVIAERLTGEAQEAPIPQRYVEWGHEHEPHARVVYEDLTGSEVKQIGLLAHPDDLNIAGSPDGLVGADGGLEIKCPYNSRVHLGYLLGGVLPKEYEAQVHGYIWMSGRDWWDFVSFDPRFVDAGLHVALFRVRVLRDDDWCARLDEAVFAFRDKLEETLQTIRERTAA